MQTKESPNQSLQGIPNKLTGEHMYRWPEITSTWFLNIKLGGCPHNNRAHLAHLYRSQIKVFLHKNNKELIDFKSSTAYALLISVVSLHTIHIFNNSSGNFPHLSGLRGSDALNQLVEARGADSYKHRLHVCSAKLPGFSKFTHFSFHLIHIFVVHPQTWQLLPLQSRWRHSYDVQRVMAPPIGPEVFLRGVLCVCVSCSMEKYQFTAYAGRCRFSDRNVKQEQGDMNEKILIIPGIVWFFNIFFTMKHKHNVPCLLFILIILIMMRTIV